jgi:L-lysine exporter family protein LysE/ArgO
VISLVPGFLTGLSLIVAIGAQNAFVIRQGLAKSYVFLVVIICAVIDALLIALGIAGLGALITATPWLLEFIRWFGVAYLTWFGLKSFRRAFSSQQMDLSGSTSDTAKKVAASVLGFTLLNPHVYLDTVILVGSIGNQFGEQRWWFGAGAMAASFVWFFGLGYGAKAASRFMTKPVFWRVLDTAIGVIMLSIAILLAVFDFAA